MLRPSTPSRSDSPSAARAIRSRERAGGAVAAARDLAAIVGLPGADPGHLVYTPYFTTYRRTGNGHRVRSEATAADIRGGRCRGNRHARRRRPREHLRADGRRAAVHDASIRALDRAPDLDPPPGRARS